MRRERYEHFLGERKFRKDHLEAEISRLTHPLEKLSLTDREKDIKLHKSYAPEEIMPIETLITPCITPLIGTIQSLLEREVISQESVQRLAENPNIEKWVEEGLHIHQGKTLCEFC